MTKNVLFGLCVLTLVAVTGPTREVSGQVITDETFIVSLLLRERYKPPLNEAEKTFLKQLRIFHKDTDYFRTQKIVVIDTLLKKNKKAEKMRAAFSAALKNSKLVTLLFGDKVKDLLQQKSNRRRLTWIEALCRVLKERGITVFPVMVGSKAKLYIDPRYFGFEVIKISDAWEIGPEQQRAIGGILVPVPKDPHESFVYFNTQKFDPKLSIPPGSLAILDPASVKQQFKQYPRYLGLALAN